MKKSLSVLNKILSTIFMILMLGILAYSCFAVFQSKTTGKPASIFGYRPVFVMSGSMEPTIKTHGIVIVKDLSNADTLNKNDVITFIADNDFVQDIVVTHRINNIDAAGNIITKGDANDCIDEYAIQRKDVQGKVVSVWNWFAKIYDTWNTTHGKVIMLGFVFGIAILIFAIRQFVVPERKENTSKNQ